mgnify:CR=1 FL=1
MTILEIITALIEQRKQNNILPECALLSDVRKECKLSDEEFREEIKRLRKGGVIEIKQTINSYSFYLK